MLYKNFETFKRVVGVFPTLLVEIIKFFCAFVMWIVVSIFNILAFIVLFLIGLCVILGRDSLYIKYKMFRYKISQLFR